MPSHCSITFCGATSGLSRVSNPVTLRRCLGQLGYPEEFVPPKSFMICSKHFTAESFKIAGNKRIIGPNPQINAESHNYIAKTRAQVRETDAALSAYARYSFPNTSAQPLGPVPSPLKPLAFVDVTQDVTDGRCSPPPVPLTAIVEGSSVKSFCQFCMTTRAGNFTVVHISDTLKQKFFDLTQIKLDTVNFNESICCTPCLKEFECVYNYRSKLIQNQKILSDMHNPAPEAENLNELMPVDDQVDDIETKKEEFVQTILVEESDCSDNSDEWVMESIEDEVSKPAVRRRPKSVRPKNKKTDPVECAECGKKIATKQGLKNHIKIVHRKDPDERIICPKCGLFFNTSTRLRSHIQWKHETTKNYQCEVCSKFFKTVDALKRHKNRHDGIKPFKCDICSKSFSQAETRNIHVDAHNKVRYTCDRCGTSYSNRVSLRKHLKRNCTRTIDPSSRAARGEGKRKGSRYNCIVPGCTRSFTIRATFGIHLEAAHDMKFKNFLATCCVCLKEFKTAGEQKEHFKSHNCKFICEICKLKFSTEEKMLGHMKKKHKEGVERPFICTEPGCGGRFRILATLKSHLNYRHRDD